VVLAPAATHDGVVIAQGDVLESPNRRFQENQENIACLSPTGNRVTAEAGRRYTVSDVRRCAGLPITAAAVVRGVTLIDWIPIRGSTRFGKGA
jgi:hypothetical protein